MTQHVALHALSKPLRSMVVTKGTSMRRSTICRRIAWLVTVALVAQSWLGQLATSAVAAEADGIVICTSSGYKIVSLPDGLGPPAAPSEADGGHLEHGLDCAACLVQAAAEAVTDLAPGHISWHWPETVSSVVSDVRPISSLYPRLHPSRAPPSI